MIAQSIASKPNREPLAVGASERVKATTKTESFGFSEGWTFALLKFASCATCPYL
jgi:hypothetical protein